MREIKIKITICTEELPRTTKKKKRKKIPSPLGEAAGSDLSRPGICAKVIFGVSIKKYIYISNFIQYK